MSAKASSAKRLDAGIKKANDLVLGASFAMMDARTPAREIAQARYFQGLFSAVRDVLINARRGLWEPGEAPDDWESFDSSRAALRLADALAAASQTDGGER